MKGTTVCKQKQSMQRRRKTLILRMLCFSFLLLSVVRPVCAQYNIDRVLMAGRSALYYEDYVLSMQYFNQAINAKPYLYEPWYYRAIAKYSLDDFVGAELDCNEAIALNPYITGIYDLRGICRIRQRKFEEAATDYTKAIKLDPINQNLWYNRALCRLNSKEYDQANAELDSMMVRWSQNAKIYQLKCEVLLQQKDTVQAEQYLDKSLELDPYDGEAWTVRAMMSLNQKNWRDADQQLTEAIRLKPTYVSNYVNRALARYNFNNLRGALADYDKAIELDPNNFLAHYNRGQLRVQVGDDNRAIDDFDFIISREPGNIMAVYNRALLLERTGDLRGAIRDLTTVIGEFPNFWAGLNLRASCYRRLGMTNQAEMDEFRIFKAQMDKHLGIQPRWSKNKKKEIRKMSDIDLDKYSQLVEADEPEVEHEYTSAYRGKVQHRKVDDELMPMFVISYRQQQGDVNKYTAFDTEVERFNSLHSKESGKGIHRNGKKPQDDDRITVTSPLYIQCNRQTMTEDETLTYFALIDTLTAAISSIRDFKNERQLLMRRAVAYTVTQNFDAAINDLSAYLQEDSTSAMAYWQRAVCQSLMHEFTQSQGIDANLRAARTLGDFDKAAELNPQNPFIFYDRACLYAARQDYSHAIDDFSHAIELDSNIAEAYFNRGLCRLRSGLRQEGIEDLSRAGERGLYNAYSIIKKYRSK